MNKLKTLLLTGALLICFNQGTAQSSYSPYSSDRNSSIFQQNNNSSSQAYRTETSSINWFSNYSDAVAQSQATSKPIAILFTGTSWCPACIQLERNVLTKADFAQAVGSRFIFLKAEFPSYTEGSVASSPYKPLLDRYGVDAFPTLVIVNANGQKLFTVEYKAGGPQVYSQEMLQKLGMQ